MSQDYYQGGVCDGNFLWMINSSQNLFRTSPCSSSINDFLWSSNINLTTNMDASSKENNHHEDITVQKPQDFGYCSTMSNPHQLSFITNNTFQDSSYDPLKTQTFLTNHLQTVVNNPITSFLSVNSSSSYDYNSSILLQNLFDMSNSPTTIHDQPRFDTSQRMSSVSFPTSGDSYGVMKESGNNLEFSYNTSVAAVTCDVGASILSSTQKPKFIASSVSNKPNKLSSTFAAKRQREVKKAHNEPSLKRKKAEDSSPSPAFKVRKEKLGDRITALQQMVSPFGKTDTASVLHETIEYIKFLHAQVGILSTPYMKNNAAPRAQYQQMNAENNSYKDQIGLQQQKDLRSRGLCLVPMSSTFPVSSEATNAADNLWTPNFGGSFK